MKEKSKEEKLEDFRKFWEFVASYASNAEVKEMFKTNIPPILKTKLTLVSNE